MTSNNGQWTAEDLPPALPFDDEEGHLHLTSVVRGALAAWLNENHPKPKPYDQGGVRDADSLLYRAERAERERDAAVARAKQLEREVSKVEGRASEWSIKAKEWQVRAEAAEARTAPAVPLHQPDGTRMDASHLPIGADDDPAVLVVRESDLPAARADGDYYVVASAKGDYKWPQHGPSWWAGRAQDALAEAARYTSLALLAADREATVDPVEAKARVEADRRYSGDPNHAFIEGAVWAARHVLGGENAV